MEQGVSVAGILSVMSALTSPRVRRLRQEQRALRRDIIVALGRPWLFVGVLCLYFVLLWVLDGLSGWFTAVALMLFLVGMWRAGKWSLDRRRSVA